MDHSLAVTQIILVCSLGVNGFWLGSRLVIWCRRRRSRLLIASLSLFGLEAVLFYLFVFAPLAAEVHVFVSAASSLNNAILLTCFYEWVRILPRPWGQGEARDG